MGEHAFLQEVAEEESDLGRPGSLLVGLEGSRKFLHDWHHLELDSNQFQVDAFNEVVALLAAEHPLEMALTSVDQFLEDEVGSLGRRLTPLLQVLVLVAKDEGFLASANGLDAVGEDVALLSAVATFRQIVVAGVEDDAELLVDFGGVLDLETIHLCVFESVV